MSASNIVADDVREDTNEDGGDNEPDHGRNTVVKSSGRLEVWMEGNNETKVQVSSQSKGIRLKLSNEMYQMNVSLLPEDIEPLCEELLDVKAKTQPEGVEYSRAWVAEDFFEAWRTIQMADTRVTGRTVRTADGKNDRKYRVNGVSSPSAEVVEAALDPR